MNVDFNVLFVSEFWVSHIILGFSQSQTIVQIKKIYEKKIF